MEIGGRKLEVGKYKRRLNKVSVSTVTTGVPIEKVREVALALGVGEDRVAAAVVEERISPKEIERVRIIEPIPEVKERPEEYMEEGLTSPW